MTNKKRHRPPKLDNATIADICQMWVAQVSVNDIAKKHGVSNGTVLEHITRCYLGTTRNKTYQIIIQSKLNEEWNEDNY